MTQTQTPTPTPTPTPNTQNQAKPNNLSAIDKKIADDKSAEQSILQASQGNRMPDQTEGKQTQPGTAASAPAQQGNNSASKN